MKCEDCSKDTDVLYKRYIDYERTQAIELCETCHENDKDFFYWIQVIAETGHSPIIILNTKLNDKEYSK